MQPSKTGKCFPPPPLSLVPRPLSPLLLLPLLLPQTPPPLASPPPCAAAPHPPWFRQVLTWRAVMQPALQGMLPILDGKFGALQRSAVQSPNSLRQIAAICNSLNPVNRSQVVGDVADFAAFQACEACYLVRWSALPLGLIVSDLRLRVLTEHGSRVGEGVRGGGAGGQRSEGGVAQGQGDWDTK